jgi:hypothetical protein
VADEDLPSERLVQQRLRNRAIEALEVLAGGDRGVRAVGTGEYVEQFFDTIDDNSPWRWREWSSFTAAEVSALDTVQQVLLDACAATPHSRSDEEFIASGWPERIKPVATAALDLMRRRGRFREDREEGSPTLTG